jgi:hypothetical protein
MNRPPGDRNFFPWISKGLTGYRRGPMKAESRTRVKTTSPMTPALFFPYLRQNLRNFEGGIVLSPDKWLFGFIRSERIYLLLIRGSRTLYKISVIRLATMTITEEKIRIPMMSG